MKIIIKSVPKNIANLPQNRVNPFSVPEQFKYGGAIEPEKFGNRRIDVYSDFLRQPTKDGGIQSPYASTGKQLKEAPEGTPNAVVVEKQEQAMGDFNGDGMPVLMGTNVGSHESGDDLTTVVPDGSFIFSDTPSLKIKDPQILDMFGVKKATTPAQIAKKFSLQDYKKILDDPNKGEVDKNTAKLMYTNYTNKLNTLASIQEDMKQKQDALKQQRSQQSPAIPMGQMKKGGRYMTDGGDLDYAPYFYMSEHGVPQGNGYTGQYGDTTKGYQKWLSEQGYVGANRKPLVIDNKFGVNTLDAYIPYSDSPAKLPIYSSSIPTDHPIVVPPSATVPDYKPSSIDTTKGHRGIPHMNGINPDTLAAITAGLRYGQYSDYNPVRQVAHGAYAQPVFADPTRAKAAIQEGVNSAANTIGMGATGPIARANILALQGKAGAQSADIEAQYAQKNAEIATRTNEQAAGLYNQLWKDQQGYNKDYAEETHNAQMDKLGYQYGVQNELLKQAYQAENRQRTAQNYNYINPYYTMDSRGYIYPKSAEQM